MPAPSVDPGLNAAATPPARRTRWWPAFGVMVGVLWLHGLLIGRLLSGPAAVVGQAGVAWQQPAAATVRVRTITPPVRLVPAPVPSAQGAPAPARPVRPARDRAARAEANAPAPAPTAGPESDAATLPSTARAADAMPDSAAEAAAAGAPPPLYATRLPAPVLLRYQWRHGSQSGETVLAWRHDGQRYLLQLDTHAGTALPALIEQRSEGGFDAAGLAPDRFTDRRRGRSQRAVNFRRDIGRIGFSGPRVDYPAWPGAQDRLSWLAQLAAVQSGATAALPLIQLFVVDAWGGAELWRLAPRGEAEVDSPLGRVTTQHWLREPERPEGQRVEVWLDPARGHWPVQLRTTWLRNGDMSELRLAAEPALPP